MEPGQAIRVETTRWVHPQCSDEELCLMMLSAT